MLQGWSIGGARVLLLLVVALLTGCATIQHKPMPAATEKDGRRTLAIFLDGTANDEQSDTNVKRLHSLVSLQERRDIATLYVEGVGTGSDVLGMGLGLGVKPRVKIAYAFILANYRADDRIFIFGFSRGAYAGRILASLLYHAGIVRGNGQLTHYEIADRVYDAVKEELPADQERIRRGRAHGLLKDQELSAGEPVAVDFLGLWDTVEALGYRDGFSKLAHKMGVAKHEVDVDNANPRYGDKLCNVREVRHAMAIDDNREWIFTPRLMTRAYLFEGCEPARPNPLLAANGAVDRGKLKEVWFAGAHSDVGGGYEDSQMSGVSLNWMLDELRGFDLVPAAARVPQDPYGTSHDPERGWFGPLYHGVNRDIVGYSLDLNTVASYRGTLCVHESVFARRKAMPPKAHESTQLELREPARACLVPAEEKDLSDRGRHAQSRDPKALCKAYLDVRQFPCLESSR